MSDLILNATKSASMTFKAPTTEDNKYALKDHIHTAEEVGALPNTTEIPTKMSQLENDKGYLTEHQDITSITDALETVAQDTEIALGRIAEVSELTKTKADIIHNHQTADITHYDGNSVESLIDILSVEILTTQFNIDAKADKPTIYYDPFADIVYRFSDSHNHEPRIIGMDMEAIHFTFGNGEYPIDYTSGLSFDSGATPTAIDYTDSGILNWVGTDCTTVDGLSIFQPSANTHYDIVFYFNGTQFIGLVNGYVPAGRNVVSE